MTSFRILIVDDQREMRRSFADELQKLGTGMDIVELPSGEEAQLVAFRKSVHLLITDVKLPGISGFDLIKRIRKNNPDLKVIIVTSLTEPRVREQVDEIGADAFFYKPVNMSELLEAARRCLAVSVGAPVGEVKEETKEASAELLEETKPVAVRAKGVESSQFVAVLSSLRAQLKAQAVAFFDLQGDMIAQAGEVSLLKEQALLSRLLVALKDSLEISRSLSQGAPSSLLCFAGAESYLCMVPVGTSQALLVVGGQAFQASLLSSGRRIILVAGELERMLEAAPEPEKAPEGITAPLEEQVAVEEVIEEAKPEDLAAIEALLSQAAEKGLQSVDVDAFWGNLEEEIESPGSTEEGVLSYEEARKMGLAPE